VVWCAVGAASFQHRRIRQGIVVALLALLASHLDAYVKNYPFVGRLTGDEPRDVSWFHIGDTTAQSLQYWLDYTENGRPLCQVDPSGQWMPARYSEIYAALAGYRFWNGGGDTPITACDWRSGNIVVLNIGLWESWYFKH